MLQEIGDPQLIRRKDKRFALTSAEPKESYQHELPMELTGEYIILRFLEVELFVTRLLLTNRSHISRRHPLQAWGSTEYEGLRHETSSVTKAQDYARRKELPAMWRVPPKLLPSSSMK